MADAIHTLGGVVFLLLPGALYVWSYERFAGQWGLNSPDRILTFFSASVVLHALASPMSFYLWHRYWHTGAIRRDSHLPLWAYLAVLGYIVVPAVLGWLVGLGTHRRWPVVSRIHARTPPRVWDEVFDRPLNGWIRIRTKSGSWVGGALSKEASVSTFPSDGDILFAPALVDRDGQFVRDDEGVPLLEEKAQLLVRWNEIDYLVVIPEEGV